jgi:hypothetical protein
MTCPHPDKIAYGSEKAAKKAKRDLARTRREGIDQMHPYRCGAHWHLGGSAWTRRKAAR